MVRASCPVASVMRLAARPVGAQSTTELSAESRRMMQLMSVVLPVPGPPVMTSTPFSSAAKIAPRCLALKLIWWLASKRSISLSAPANLSGVSAATSSMSRWATSFSALK